MKYSEVNGMSVAELKNMVRKKSDEIFELNVKNRLGQVSNPLSVRIARKDLARFLTALSSKKASVNGKK